MTAASSRPPRELDWEGGERPDRLVRLGPSLHGWIYQSVPGGAMYRLLSIDVTSLEWRQQLRGWLNLDNTAAGLARLTHAEQFGDGWLLMRYEVGEDTLTLEKILECLLPGLRLASVAKVCEAVPRWRKLLGAPLLFTPAEIVLGARLQPLLLGMPFLRLPEPEQVFVEPRRALYLPPELTGVRGARGWEQGGWYNADRYLVGVLVTQCIYPPAALPPPDVALGRVANGTLLEAVCSGGMKPFWLRRMPAAREALGFAQRLAAADPAGRGALDLGELAARLGWCAERLTPEKSVEELLAFSTPFEALGLLKDVLLAEESYEYLVLAGRTAADAVGQPLEALDFFERAIHLQPEREGAYEAQLALLARASEFAALVEMCQMEGLKLDAIIWRDFERLSPEGQQRQEVAFARYLLWRGQLDQALVFTYPRLFDEKREHQWWKIGLNRAYARALLERARLSLLGGSAETAAHLEAAEVQLKVVQEALRILRRRGELESTEWQEHGEAIDVLAYELHELRTRRQGPPSTNP